MQLIDADALLKKCIEGDSDNKFTEGYNFAVQEISAKITLAPTIEAEPVRNGRWIQSDALDYKDPNGVIHVHGMCSCCRLIYDFRDMTSRFKFCPNCGARMDGGAYNA